MSNEFTHDELVEILRLKLQDHVGSRRIAKMYGRGKTTINDFLSRKTYKQFWEEYDKRPVAGGVVAHPESKRGSFKGARFVFTSAQNNTYVHDKFLKSLEQYCLHNNSQLVVGTFHYNKSGFQNGADKEIWYDPKIRGYICDEPMQIANKLVWCGELNILPTAKTPLSGLYNYTADNSAIVPHAKVQLESVPTPKFDDPKLMYTTGAVTQMNYVQMKAGQIAEWHHIFGALAVEIDEDGDWFVRQLIAESDTGEFYDLGERYTPSGVSCNHRIEAINYGDIHAAKLDDVVAETSWRSPNSILDTLKPKYQFIHDVLDQQARNHHNIRDPHFMFRMFNNQTESVKDEVVLTANVIKETVRDFSQTVVVESNHDLALTKWLKEQDYRYDPVNAVFFLEMQLASYKAIEQGGALASFEYACKTYCDGLDSVKFLGTDESFRIGTGIECGSHGHNGNNGSRGSMQTYLKLGIKHNLGHVHGAAIRDGVYYAGVSGKLDMQYNIGGGSWQNSHIITYQNSKRAIITLKNGKWRA